MSATGYEHEKNSLTINVVIVIIEVTIPIRSGAQKLVIEWHSRQSLGR